MVSLLLLLVMTVLALTASQSTLMQERMAGNARDLDLAFQAGEAGLRGAETRIDGMIPQSLVVCGDRDTCDAESRDTAVLDFESQTYQWWLDTARPRARRLRRSRKSRAITPKCGPMFLTR